MQNQRADKQIFSEPVSDHGHSPQRLKKRLLRLGLWIMLLAIALAIFLINWGVENKQQELETSLQKRLEVLAKGRVDVISVWLSSLAEQGNRITHSDLFRLYAAEIDLIEEDLSLLLTAPLSSRNENGEEIQQLSAQLPLMENLLREFTQYADFLSGRIINRSGHSYISTDSGTKALSKEQLKLAQTAINENRILFSPAEATGNGLVINLFLPITPPQANQQAVAVLLLSKNVSNKINEILAPTPLAEKGERTRLLQQQINGYAELVPWLPGELMPLPQPLFFEQQQLPFAERSAIREQQSVYSLAMKVPELNWWVLQEANVAISSAPLKEFQRISISMFALISLLFLVLAGALWWRLIGTENRKMADQFKLLAEQIEEQRQLLDSINGNLSEYIGLKDNAGQYRYVNPAFAAAVGRSQEELIGLDDAAVFGFDTAKRLASSDRQVIENRQQITINEDIYLLSELHHLQISKVPFVDRDGQLAGIIASFRDVTEVVQQQRKTERATRQTIEALAKTVELNDPYLAGHSRLMSSLAVATAKALNCTEQIVATVETASFLSQIGKMFVDQDLMQKPGALSDEEKRQIEKHVEHSANILHDIEFDLPIFDSIFQMNELLDGSGYPKGLTEEEIILPAKILAVCNSFAAMLKPRSYRPARPLNDIFDILATASVKYDTTIVTALREVAHSPAGEKILNEQA